MDLNILPKGYKKIRAPPKLFRIIQEFWQKNRHNQTTEVWSAGETTTNHWVNPSSMVNIGDTVYEGGGAELYDAIAEAARLSIQEWTSMELTSTSVYGIRIYNEGSILAPHVDRLPLISSAIINVDQDVDEPWPLEVIGHNGVAENVTMLPGDLVLYESHSVIHGMFK
jgi:prolyl 4-hydroxylase